MSRDAAFALKISLLLLMLAEAIGATGIVPAPHTQLTILLEGEATNALYAIGFTLAHVHFLHIMFRPGWREYAMTFAGGIAIFALLVVVDASAADRSPRELLLLLFSGLGSSSLVAFTLRALYATGIRQAQGKEMLAISFLLQLFSATVGTYLHLTSALHPLTYDSLAFRIENTLGFQPSQILALWADSRPPLRQVMIDSYNGILLGFFALFGLEATSGKRLPVSTLRLYVFAGIAASLLYHLCPITGPRFLFEGYFPHALPPADTVLLDSTIVRPTARNGMPSMHFASSLLLWMNAGYVGRWARAGFAVLVGLTVLATLGLGEHYLVDLAAGVPAAVALQALCTRVLPWQARERRNAVLWGAALVAFWMIAVRFGVEVFLALPGLLWVAMLGTLAACVALYRPLARASRAALALPQAPAPAAAPSAQDAGARREVRAVGLMFVLSGFAGLVYQVLFSKALALSFGSAAIATYTVLATYMGGMALGAWLGGRLAAQRADALKLYAYCELGIGAYCLATPWIFQAIQALYVTLAAGSPADAAELTVLRVLLGAAALSVPTILMGMTLPILARFFQSRSASLGASVALLYGANTVGAALGALLAGYLVIPALGMFKTTLSTALLNLVVAALALRLFGQLPAEASATPLASATHPAASADPGARRLGQLALLLLALGGVVTLALEVNYIHLLAVVAGNSVYAFSLMLFAFLLGLAGGAEIARWLLLARAPLALCLAWIEFALAAAVLLGVYQWGSLPEYFASFAFYPVADAFGTRELIRGLVCVVAMLPPALAIGALYPLAMEAVGRAHPAQPIRALGYAAALNTAGNIVGVLLAGFVLLPAIGALRSVQGLALLCLLLGVAVLALAGTRERVGGTRERVVGTRERVGGTRERVGGTRERVGGTHTRVGQVRAWAPVPVLLLLFALQPASFDYGALASGANVYFAPQNYGQVIDHAESADGGLTTVSEGPPLDGQRSLTLLTNGKFQGSNGGEMTAQIGFAVAPLLHTPARSRALVIGYGTGVSSRTLHEAGFQSLDIVDLSADIVRLANTHFADINATVSTRPGVHTHITDGRNFLLLQERAYDLVSMEISSIWFAGAASLYNREFYQLVKRRLRPDGVLQQWVQLHHLTPLDLLYILGSVRAEFSHVWVYYIGGQGIIVATNDPRRQPARENFHKLQTTASFAPLLRQLDAPYEALASSILLNPAGTERFLNAFSAPASRWVSTDDNLFLEYSTPKGNVLDGNLSKERNVDMLWKMGGR
jgi:spermidine synthase